MSLRFVTPSSHCDSRVSDLLYDTCLDSQHGLHVHAEHNNSDPYVISEGNVPTWRRTQENIMKQMLDTGAISHAI